MNDLRPFKPEYFIMCGKDSAGAIYPIAVDSDGNLLSAKNKGWYDDEAALVAAYPNGIATPADRNGWFAIVGDTDTVWVWDAGTNAWVDSGAGGLVTSVFGRTGAVVATANDYDASEVNNDSGVAGADVGAALDTLETAIGSAGDVVGPASATDNALARYDAATGKLLQDGKTIEDDSGNVAIGGAATATNIVSSGDNVALGVGAYSGAGVKSGNHITAIGMDALGKATSAVHCTAVGHKALGNITSDSGSSNTAVGDQALNTLAVKNANTALGFQAGFTTQEAFGIYLGWRAGYYETAANKLFIDNAGRTNEADGRVKALIYGVFDAATANQSVLVNGYFTAREALKSLERSSDPTEPSEGQMIIWMSDGSGMGDDGDIMAGTQAGGVTKYRTLFDHSGGTNGIPNPTYAAGSFDYPAANPAPLDTDTGTNGTIKRHLFDDSTEEFVLGQFKVPDNIDTGGTVTFKVYGYAVTADGNELQLRFGHSAGGDSDTWDAAFTDEDSGDLVTDGTQDDLDYFTWTETVSNLGWSANDFCRFQLSRIAIDDGTPVSGDYGVTYFEINIPRA